MEQIKLRNFEIEILKLNVTGTILDIGIKITGKYNPNVRNPVVTIIFLSEGKYRRLPVPVNLYQPETDLKSFLLLADYSYSLEDLYIDSKTPDNITLKIEFTYGDESDEIFEDKLSVKVPVLKRQAPSFWCVVLFILLIMLLPLFFIEAIFEMLHVITTSSPKKYRGVMGVIEHMRWRSELILDRKIGISTFKNIMTKLGYGLFRLCRVKANRVAFISNRRNNISGNYESIYNELAKNKEIDIKTVLDTKESLISCFKYGYYLATSKVILIDDYIRSVYEIKKRQDNYFIQVWHACGAFKTFGFSRLSKEGCWPQNSRSHRTYDYCTVSSKNVAKYYAEAFGMNIENIIATGVPRTDIFFDGDYKLKTKEKIYISYPELRNKKIILFAPTFRGSSKKEGNYPHRYFDYEKIFEKFGDEYRIIIKHHPHVNNKLAIPERYMDKVVDLSKNEELNDLLFITDILITDYSSVIFEASLLNIPMLFYAFDLWEYISVRGFYYEYLSFVPGKVVYNMNEILDSLKNNDFETDKIYSFKKKFFDNFDGKSGRRVSEFIEELMG